MIDNKRHISKVWMLYFTFKKMFNELNAIFPQNFENELLK